MIGKNFEFYCEEDYTDQYLDTTDALRSSVMPTFVPNFSKVKKDRKLLVFGFSILKIGTHQG